MKTIRVPINEAGPELNLLVKQIETGVTVCLTQYGEPKVLMIPLPGRVAPWRAEAPDNPALYGDLQSPVLEDWK